MNRGNTSPENRGMKSGHNDESPPSGVDRIGPVAYSEVYKKAIALYHKYCQNRIHAKRKPFSTFLSNDRLSAGLTDQERLLLLEGILTIPGRKELDDAHIYEAIDRLSGETRKEVYGQGGPVSEVRQSTTPPKAGSDDELELAEGAEASSKEGNAAGTGDFDFDLSDLDQKAATGDEAPNPDDDSADVA